MVRKLTSLLAALSVFLAVPMTVWAQEAADAPPEIEESIFILPIGTVLTLPPPKGNLTEPILHTVPFKAFLLPESHYDTALSKAKQLDICLTGLDTCTTTALEWQGRVATALQSCSDQFDTDEELIDGFSIQIRDLETDVLRAEEKASKNARMAGIGWAIVGGLVAGGVFAAALTFGG
jgi:hypothetical protein